MLNNSKKIYLTKKKMGNNARMIKAPNQTPDTENIAPSYFIIQAIETGVKKIVPNGVASFENNPTSTVQLGLNYKWHQLKKQTQPDATDLLTINEGEQNVVCAQIGEQLRNNQISLTSTTKLTNVAHSISIRNTVQRVLAQNPHSHLLNEVEKRGIVASQSDINNALMEMSGTTDIDAAMRTINNVGENTDFRAPETNPLEVLAHGVKSGLAQSHKFIQKIPSPQTILENTLHTGVEIFLEISDFINVHKHSLLARIKTAREKHIDGHVDSFFDVLNRAPKAKIISPERSEPLTKRVIRSLREKVTTLLEDQSNAPEGLRTQIARLLTGKEPLPKPTFHAKKTSDIDWTEQSLEKIHNLIGTVRKIMPHVRPSQLNIILGLATLNTGGSQHPDVDPKNENKPITREVGISHGGETCSHQIDSENLAEWHKEKERETQINSISDWTHRVQSMTDLPTPVIDMVTGEIHLHLSTKGAMTDDILRVMIQKACTRNANNLAQDKQDALQRANEMLQRIEAQKRGVIQQAGGIDPNRGGAKMVQAFAQLPENGNPAEIQEIMNKAGLFA